MNNTLSHAAPRGLLARVARIAYRRRRFVLLGWISLLIALSVLSATAGGELRNDFSLRGAEFEQANRLLEDGELGDRAGYTGQIVFATPSHTQDGVRDPEVRRAMAAFFAQVVAAVPEVRVASPYEPSAHNRIAPRGDVAFAEVRFGDISVDDATDLADAIVAVRAGFQPPEGVQVDLGGELFFEQSEFSAEAFGFLAAMVILLIAFGSVLAMGLPLVTALFGIGCGLALVMIGANVIDIPEYGPQGAMLVSIGVGIDYALLIVARYRDELRSGYRPEDAVERAMATAGRSVLFAGCTVVIALLGLLLGGVSVSQAMAIAMSVGVLMVMLASLTLVPALLGFAGNNIDRFSIHRRNRTAKDPRATLWYRWSRFVQRRPLPIAAVALVVLVALAVPLFSMRLGIGDAGNRPDTDTSRRAYDTLSDGFGPGYNGPLFLAVDLPGDDDQNAAVLAALDAGLEADDGVGLALPPVINEAGDVGFVQAFPTTSPQDRATFDTVNRLRDRVVPAVVDGTAARVLVGGMPAATVDFAAVQSGQMPIFIGAVLVLSFLLLLAVFRSVLVALKAVIMNLLSVGAAYGAIVAVFQWGWVAGLLGVGQPGPIEVWLPMMLFAITFGLSIDYEVFLLSRIKEEHEATGDTGEAVADGLAKTGRLITAAAAIMVCVAGGFVLSDERALQMFGLGLAVAIFVDAAIVRSLLVPAAMELLGERNWWMPRWLDRVLPRIDIDGAVTMPSLPPVPDFALPLPSDSERQARSPEQIG